MNRLISQQRALSLQ